MDKLWQRITGGQYKGMSWIGPMLLASDRFPGWKNVIVVDGSSWARRDVPERYLCSIGTVDVLESAV